MIVATTMCAATRSNSREQGGEQWREWLPAEFDPVLSVRMGGEGVVGAELGGDLVRQIGRQTFRLVVGGQLAELLVGRRGRADAELPPA